MSARPLRSCSDRSCKSRVAGNESAAAVVRSDMRGSSSRRARSHAPPRRARRGIRLYEPGRPVLLTVTMFIGTLLLSGCHFDNMFKTGNANADCFDGGSTFRSGDFFCQTDNATLTYWLNISDLTASERNAINATLFGSFDTTDLDVDAHGTPVYSGGGETDIIYENGSDVPTGSDGVTWCDDAVSTVECDQHYIHYRPAFAVSVELACHETGHAIGLTHGQDAAPRVRNDNADLGCMRDPTFGGQRWLGVHNESQINGTY